MESSLGASLVTTDQSDARKFCCGVPAPSVSTAGLRCRFGNVEVPASVDGGMVSCCPPSKEVLRGQAGSGQAVPVQVVDGEERCVAENTYSLAASSSAMTSPDGLPAEGKGGELVPPGEVTLTMDGEQAAGDDSRRPAQDTGGRREGESRRDYMKREYSALKPFVIISLSYLLFTTTDGAIRMIVLLHAYNAGFTAWEVAIMFTLYEVAGVFTNLLAGVAGARWGIKNTLLTGLTLQLAGIAVLYAWQDEWNDEGQKWKAIVFVTFAQMLCGIAKDLTKLGGKTVTKLVTPDEKQSRLFKLVSFITGWKNSLKGVGYFIGAACLAYNYYFALGVLLFLILLAMPWAAVGLSNQLGRARKENLTLKRIFTQNYNISVLSVSRFFLFGSRDLWFEVPLPFFLRDAVYGLGWSRPLTGLFLALFIIIYGQVQSWTPQMVLQPLRQSPANKWVNLLWCGVLTVCPLTLALVMQCSDVYTGNDKAGMTASLISVLGAFCLVFAVNSAVHSYLIVKYAEGDKVALNIGFYYMANSCGRLTGTLVSGALYSFAGDTPITGFAACFWASTGFVLLSTLVDVFIRDNSGGLSCGSCLTLVPAPPPDPKSKPLEVEVE